MGRMNEEARTVALMIQLYCRVHHKNALCAECTELLEYAQKRIEYCPYTIKKPVCAQCPVHCYAPEQRERIREIMRYAGPRMLFRHPVLALRHMLRSRVYFFGGRSK
jgi:predicted amidophosphoribosyltransferase